MANRIKLPKTPYSCVRPSALEYYEEDWVERWEKIYVKSLEMCGSRNKEFWKMDARRGSV